MVGQNDSWLSFRNSFRWPKAIFYCQRRLRKGLHILMLSLCQPCQPCQPAVTVVYPNVVIVVPFAVETLQVLEYNSQM